MWFKKKEKESEMTKMDLLVENTFMKIKLLDKLEDYDENLKKVVKESLEQAVKIGIAAGYREANEENDGHCYGPFQSWKSSFTINGKPVDATPEMEKAFSAMNDALNTMNDSFKKGN
jgi:chromosomal replication initiation ATPase DnaA